MIIHHGFIAQMTHHRFNAQAFAEAGYLAISVNGTHPADRRAERSAQRERRPRHGLAGVGRVRRDR